MTEELRHFVRLLVNAIHDEIPKDAIDGIDEDMAKYLISTTILKIIERSGSQWQEYVKK